MEVFPVVAIYALRVLDTLWHLVVLFKHTVDDHKNPMVANSNTPAEVIDGVVLTNLSGVTLCLHSIAGEGTRCCYTIAGPHVNWIGGVAEMEDTGVLFRLRRVRIRPWRSWKA